MSETSGALPDGHARLVANKLLEGRVVPFLGAGVNLCDRPDGFVWEGSEQRYLPSGWELARELAAISTIKRQSRPARRRPTNASAQGPTWTWPASRSTAT